MVSSFLDVVQRNPQRSAAIFLADGERDERKLTYAELDHCCRDLAGRLATSVRPGDRVLIMCEPGLEYVVAFVGCLYAGAIPVPAYPPSPLLLERSMERLGEVVKDSGARHAVTTQLLDPVLRDDDLRARLLAGLTWTTLDLALSAAARPTAAPVHDAAGDDVAFLQYTSGSTLAPKGVMVTHDNLHANLAMIVAKYELPSNLTVVSWLPPYHDMGLIGMILTPLLTGGMVVMLSPEAFLRRPMRWLRALARYEGFISAAPNFAYDLCVRRSSPDDVASLDLHAWKVAINGAEPVSAQTVQGFVDRFAPSGFRAESMWPSYGLAEVTLLAAAGGLHNQAHIVDVDREELGRGRLLPSGGGASHQLVTCGGAPGPSRVFIARGTGDLDEVPAGQIGEIVVAGPHVAGGYWGNPGATAAAFRECPDGTRCFVTGDLGAMTGGELVVTGRAKDVIIVRGQNHYPQDLERTVDGAHAVLRPGCGVALGLPDEAGGERLVIVYEVRHSDDLAAEEIVRVVMNSVTEAHGIRPDGVYLIAPRTLPKTSSGKVRRSATRSALLNGDLDVVHQWRTSKLDGALRERR